GGNDRSVRFGWAALLLMALPMLVQNATFTWTKLPAAFFVLCGVAVLAVREAAFPARLAGWLSLTAAMLAHYSAGPWLLAVAAAELVRSGWRSFFTRSFLTIAFACGLFFLTWFGWSVWRLGWAETMGSNTTVAYSAGMTVGQRLGAVAQNLYYSTVPVFFRHFGSDPTTVDAVVRLRDRYFYSVQSSIVMLAGSLGLAVAIGSLWTRRRQLQRGEIFYWGTLLGMAVLLGIGVHTEVHAQGVAHVCLTSFGLLVVAWLAARVPAGPRGWQVLLAIGAAVDLALGIVLHFAVQSLWLPRWLHPGTAFNLTADLGRASKVNFEARRYIINDRYLWDLPEAAFLSVLLLVAAALLLYRCFRASAADAPVRQEPAGSLPSVPGVWEVRLGRLLFLAAFGFFLWGISVGWESKRLAGDEPRQAATALSAHFIKQENNFSFDYPTPVLGKPWAVPQEFPLYPWTVAVFSKMSSLGITMSGRVVSIACFLLALPAVNLLLARWRVEPARRWIVLAVIVSCPLYIFYARAVLMETMALMMGLWYWVAFDRAVERRSGAWLAAAALAGTGTALVNATTLLFYSVPVVAWCVSRMWAGRATGAWRRELAWAAGAMLLPLAAGLGWSHHADTVTAQNPMAAWVTPERLAAFRFGTPGARFGSYYWTTKWRILTEEVTVVPVVMGCLAMAFLVGSRRWRTMLLCVAAFGAALVIFPLLYASGASHYVSTTVLLLLAMGLALVALLESSAPRWLALAAAGMVIVGQAAGYFDQYYFAQREAGPGGGELGAMLRNVTASDECLVIAGRECNAVTPYYAQRRALMIRNDYVYQPETLAAARSQLAGEKLGALVIEGSLEPAAPLIEWGAQHGLAREPALRWRGCTIFLAEGRRSGFATSR
ncbi:MAG TPA: hypothetical protein VFJ90_16485, partial [Candidatus Didemnitutus sp.]|nr:hypothetical protein [Candidatus Didemnitutus sp.]